MTGKGASASEAHRSVRATVSGAASPPYRAVANCADGQLKKDISSPGLTSAKMLMVPSIPIQTARDRMASQLKTGQ